MAPSGPTAHSLCLAHSPSPVYSVYSLHPSLLWSLPPALPLVLTPFQYSHRCCIVLLLVLRLACHCSIAAATSSVRQKPAFGWPSMSWVGAARRAKASMSCRRPVRHGILNRVLGLAGTPLDGLLAEQWWLQAVSDGNALVQYELGTFYAGGQVRPILFRADR